MKKNIVVYIKTEEEGRRRMAQAAPDYNLIFDYDKKYAADCAAVIGNIPVDDIKDNKNLLWLQLSMAGTEPYSIPGKINPETVITNSSGAFGLAISEYMVGYVFELYKKLAIYRDNQNMSLWQDMGNVMRVEGSRVLVLGMGDIGGSFARKMKALGCYIVGICRTEKEKPHYCDELYTQESLDSEIPKADIIAMALPGTPETAGIISKDRIAKMKNSAIIINVGRGSAIDTDALTEALQNDKIYGCALDVTDPEPLPPEHQLWKCKNAIITPHITGFFHLRDTYDMIIDICVENLRRFQNGEKLLNIVDKDTRYRKNGDGVFSSEMRSTK